MLICLIAFCTVWAFLFDSSHLPKYFRHWLGVEGGLVTWRPSRDLPLQACICVREADPSFSPCTQQAMVSSAVSSQAPAPEASAPSSEILCPRAGGVLWGSVLGILTASQRAVLSGVTHLLSETLHLRLTTHSVLSGAAE